MADVTTTVRAVVAVIDKATAPLRAIQSQFKSFGGGLAGMGGKLRALGDSAPMQRLGSAFKNVGTAARGVFGDLTKILGPLAGLVGVTGLGGLTVALNRFSSEGERLQNLSAATGETVEHLQELAHWAEISGISSEALEKAIARTNKTAGEAAHGNKTAAATFKSLGISIKDSSGHVRTFGEIAPVLADHFARMKSPTERARLGAKLFGKSWAEIVPLLAQGKEALAQATEEARKHGLLTDADTKAGDRLGDAQQNLAAALGGVANVISRKLAPILAPIVEDFSAWIDANREWLATDIVGRLQSLAESFKAMAEHVGGVTNALLILGGIVGTIIFGPLIAALAGLAAAMISAASAAGLFTLAALPWIAAIAAIIAVVYLLWRNADMVAEAWDAAIGLISAGWTGLVTVVAAAWAAIKATGAQMAADMLGQWQSLDAAVRGIFSALGEAIAKAWAAIWDGIKTTAAAIAGDVVGQLRSLLTFWDDVSSAALGAFGKIGDAWRTLKGFFGGGVGDAAALASGAGAGAGARGAPPGPRGLAAAGAAGAPGAAGRVDIVLTAPNQPPGTRIATKTSGKNLQSRADVGFSMPQIMTPAGAR